LTSRFLLATLHLDSLKGKRTEGHIEEALKLLPKGSESLRTAYDSAVERIELQNKDDCNWARRVLCWVVHAKRPLTPAELQQALAVRPGDRELRTKYLPRIGEIVSLCAGLITLNQESDVVQLVHYTAQQYFENIQQQPDWICTAQIEISKCCLTYLAFDTFASGPTPDVKTSKERMAQNVFLDYAARHWGKHAYRVQRDVANVAKTFLQDSFLTSCASQALFFKHGYMQKIPKVSGLHLAAEFGLDILLSNLLSQMQERNSPIVDMPDSYGRTPLFLAAAGGYEKVVGLLIDAGAKVKGEKFSRSALHEAAMRGHEKVVELLLKARTDVNAPAIEYGNALQAAADARPREGGGAAILLDALTTASAGGHEKVVELLLATGVDISAESGFDGYTALRAASASGHEKAVELLLDAGADVNAEGGFYDDTALRAASAGGHEKAVELLLAAGANVNAEGGLRNDTALRAASAGGHEKAVELLLAAGANVKVEGGSYSNIARWAASAGSHKFRGDFTAQEEGYGNALWAASAGGHEKVVELLLGAGADVNAENGYHGDTALRVSSASGHEKVIKLLLEAGADANTRGGFYGSALGAAAGRGHEKVVELLLKAGTDVNAPGIEYGNALQAASAGGHEKVVELLLDAGADINARGGRYGTALQAAQEGNHKKVVELLTTSQQRDSHLVTSALLGQESS
jgi:ankyrin repeat protein